MIEVSCFVVIVCGFLLIASIVNDAATVDINKKLRICKVIVNISTINMFIAIANLLYTLYVQSN